MLKYLLKNISLDTDGTPHSLPDLSIHANHAIHAMISSNVYVKQSLKENFWDSLFDHLEKYKNLPWSIHLFSNSCQASFEVKRALTQN